MTSRNNSNIEVHDNSINSSFQGQVPPMSATRTLMHGRLSLAPHLLQSSNIKGSLVDLGVNQQSSQGTTLIPSTPVNQNIPMNGVPGTLHLPQSIGRMSLGPARNAKTTTTPIQASNSQLMNNTPFGVPLTKIPQVQFHIPESKVISNFQQSVPSSQQPTSASQHLLGSQNLINSSLGQQSAERHSLAANANSRAPLMPRPSLAANSHISSSQPNPFQISTNRNNPSSEPSQATRISLTARRSSSSSRPGGLSAGSVSLSNASNGGAMMIKDPRPIRDKTFQYSCIRSLIKFLAESSYDNPISPKILSSPSAKDFQSIFKFLYSCLDPAYEWGQGKFEEEVPLLLKTIKYPFASDISKSYLYAVGSMHAWPTLLAMLQWLVELILCCDQIQSSIDDQMAPKIGSEEFGDLDGGGSLSKDDVVADSEKMFYDYLTKSYKMFLSGDDHYEELQDKLTQNFVRKNTTVLSEMNVLLQDISLLESQIQDLEGTESPIIQLEKVRVQLESDIEKYSKYIKHQQGKRSKLESILHTYSEDLSLLRQELEQLQGEKCRLEDVIVGQSISPEDVDRMRNERETLTKNLEYVFKLKDEWYKNIQDHETDFIEKFDSITKLIKDYNDLAEKLSLIPSSGKHAHGKNYELSLVELPLEKFAHLAASATTLQILSLDLRGQVLPVIEAMRDSYQSSCRELSSELLGCQELIDKLTESTNDKIEEILFIEEKIKKMTLQYSNLKEQAMMENKLASQEMENLEGELDTMKNDLATGFLLSQQQLQKITMEWDTLTRRQMDEKERLGKLVFVLLEQSIALKNHVQTKLDELQNWVNTIEQ